MNDDISLRPLRLPEDEQFDVAVYASVRTPELASLGWTPGQIADFIRMQHQAQTRYYRQHYSEADYSVVSVSGEAAGRLIVSRTERRIHIVDIALLPPYRSVGVGGILIRRLLVEADEASLSLRCYVEFSNPARAFWEHLGLVPIRLDGAYILMERQCATSPR